MGPEEPVTKAGARGQNLQLGTSLHCPPGSKTCSRDRDVSVKDIVTQPPSRELGASNGPAAPLREILTALKPSEITPI